MPRRSQEDRSQTTKAALVQTGRRLFAERGYAAVSAEEVVAAAGVTRGALYHHFGDKRGLFEAVLEEVERENLAAIEALPDAIGRLTNLRELHLRNNRLVTLPESIGGLTSLRQLDLRGNPLTSLPAALFALPRLEKLDLRWVTSLSMPGELAQLEERGCIVYG